MKEILYTAGEIARIAGVSLRTIRFYDAKGLLKPVSHSEAGYRYYNQDSLAVLQRILTLKYLGFSLQKIEEIMSSRSMEQQLTEQKELLLQKKRQLEEILSAMEMMENSRESDKLGFLIRLLNLLTEEEKIQEQYRTSGNLEKRIRLHDYSTSPQGWMEWVYERLELGENEDVLDLVGIRRCVFCKFQTRIAQVSLCQLRLEYRIRLRVRTPGLRLTLTDRSAGMLEKAKENLSVFRKILDEKQVEIECRICDADSLELEKERYDCIVANHMLYHVKRREACLREIAHGLKSTGRFLCSTIGDGHMRELHELVAAFDARIEMPFESITKAFRLENAGPQLQAFFPQVERMDQDNDLIVDDIEAICGYVSSYPGNAACILEQRAEEFRSLLRKRMDREGAIFIHKSTGMFRCRL